MYVHSTEQCIESPLVTPVQDGPCHRVGTDPFFLEKKTYLLVVDYFSLYIEAAHLNVASAGAVAATLR